MVLTETISSLLLSLAGAGSLDNLSAVISLLVFDMFAGFFLTLLFEFVTAIAHPIIKAITITAKPIISFFLIGGNDS